MRKNLAIASGAVVAVAATLGLTLSGVLAPSVDGAATPNAAMSTLKNVDTAARSLADAPAATYDGAITLALTSGSLTLDVGNLTVTAAGDVHGTVRRNGGKVELLQIAGKTLVKGDAAFWRKETQVKQPAGVLTEASPVNKWVAVEETFLGIDLREALNPARLGTVLLQQDTLLGDAEVTGTPVGRGTETPDKRVASGTDPSGVTETEVHDADGGVAGTRRYQVGGMSVGADDDGVLAGLRGPLGKGFGGDLAKVDADLRVKVLDAPGAEAVYTTARREITPGKIGSWPMTVGDPTGSLDCAATTCSVNYDLTNAASGLDRGTVDITVSSTFKSGGREVGTCTGHGTMPINGRGHVSCEINHRQTADIRSSTRFTLVVNGEVDPTALDNAISQGKARIADAGGWTMTSPKATEPARRYNHQIALVPSGYVLTIGGFGFDGRESDGTLLLVHTVGYEAHVGTDGTLDPAWAGTQQIVAQARDARVAVGSKPIRMVFAEQRAADAVRTLLFANNVAGVDVVHVPLYSDSL